MSSKAIHTNYVCRCGHSSHSHFLMRGECDLHRKCECTEFHLSRVVLTLSAYGPILDGCTVTRLNEFLEQNQKYSAED